jgi:hypothetical protein
MGAPTNPIGFPVPRIGFGHLRQGRVNGGLARARAEGKTLGRPRTDKATEAAIRAAMKAGDVGMHTIAADASRKPVDPSDHQHATFAEEVEHGPQFLPAPDGFSERIMVHPSASGRQPACRGPDLWC